MTRTPITWDRLRAIFGNPKPVANVTERQFDYNDDKLQELGRTPFQDIDFDDLWYYHHDLAHVELQPDLFAYLFPVCLMDWHQTLLANQPCSHGDSEFHYGIVSGNVLSKMLNEQQRDKVFEVFEDSMLHRLDAERGFQYVGSGTPAYAWMSRLNSLGIFLPTFPRLWQKWWVIESPGHAVCALQYCSGLMYFEGENPLFGKWTEAEGGGGPYLCENDSYFYDRGWMEQNVTFLSGYLTPQRVTEVVQLAAMRLKGEPEEGIAAKLVRDLVECSDLIESRVADLPKILASQERREWTV